KYDINGNIINKSDVGDYSYNAASGVRPHTPNSITGIKTNTSTNTNNQDRTYTYDANGSMTKNDDKTIQWTSFNKPKSFTKGKDSTTFTYGPDRSRYQKVQTRSSDNTTITTQYFGKIYEKIKQNTNTEHKHFIYADGQLIAIHIKTDTTSAAGTSSTTDTPATPIPDKTRYLHYDNLGSIDTITDGQGNIVERMAYTAFGQRRKGDWRASDPLLPIIPALTNRGFTGHEHIDEMGFIHMNGRVYDPQIGRFLSADPHIQDPYNTQSYNRYSYVMNNPLKYTDPSGYWWNPFKAVAKAWRNAWRSVKKYGRQIASIAVLFIPGLNIYAAGFLSGMVGSKGDLKQGLLGALTAGFNAKVLHPMKAGFRKLIAHGLTGGVRSRLSGGSFKSGFLGSAVSYGASWSGAYEAAGVSNQASGWTQRVQNVVASYVVGGVAAELGGGKFANGGMSAAFSRMFNDFGNAESENSGEKTSSGWSGWGLTGVIFSGVGGMLALLPHPFSKVIGYGMMSIGVTMQVYEAKLMVGQYLGVNSEVMKNKNAMNKYHREQEEELKKIGF
ncbi:Rhs-family protein, partial [Bathymodiolus azoricus thioautotrophic gill symbiont]